MPLFEYKGYDHAGNATTGCMPAASIEEVERKMLNQQITLVYVRASTGRKTADSAGQDLPSGPSFRRARRIPDREAAKILNGLASMVKVGVPFVEALDAIDAMTTREVTKAGLRSLRARIVEGKSLGEALASARTLFPELVADVVRVAEEGGDLAGALAGAAQMLSRTDELRRKVKHAMLYPAVMLSVSFVTVLVLVVFVMPRFSEVFEQMNAEIPVTTRLLIDLGTTLKAHPIGFSIGFLAAIFGIRQALRNERVSWFAGAVAMRLPGLGDLLKMLALSRSLQAVSALVNVNVPIIDALRHGARVAGQKRLAMAINSSIDQVQQGDTLHAAFSRQKTFPANVTQMVGVGERTGNLALMIGQCATEMETEADAKLKALVSILEPLLIVVMGLIVGTITVSIILPIYSAVQSAK